MTALSSGGRFLSNNSFPSLEGLAVFYLPLVPPLQKLILDHHRQQPCATKSLILAGAFAGSALDPRHPIARVLGLKGILTELQGRQATRYSSSAVQ
jgi:hypothetical protein